VTGSARLDIYSRGGDSLQGRYFLYRLHPFTLSEVLGAGPLGAMDLLPALPQDPGRDAAVELQDLLTLVGFPEPLFSASARRVSAAADPRESAGRAAERRDGGRGAADIRRLA
jgi:hypothetical protein